MRVSGAEANARARACVLCHLFGLVVVCSVHQLLAELEGVLLAAQPERELDVVAALEGEGGGAVEREGDAAALERLGVRPGLQDAAGLVDGRAAQLGARQPQLAVGEACGALPERVELAEHRVALVVRVQPVVVAREHPVLEEREPAGRVVVEGAHRRRARVVGHVRHARLARRVGAEGRALVLRAQQPRVALQADPRHGGAALALPGRDLGRVHGQLRPAAGETEIVQNARAVKNGANLSLDTAVDIAGTPDGPGPACLAPRERCAPRALTARARVSRGTRRACRADAARAFQTPRASPAPARRPQLERALATTPTLRGLA